MTKKGPSDEYFLIIFLYYTLNIKRVLFKKNLNKLLILESFQIYKIVTKKI